MKKCLLWGTGDIFRMYFSMIMYYEEKGIIQIVGITSNERYYKSIMGIRFIEKADIDILSFDVLIVMADSFVLKSICIEAKEIGIDDSRIVPVKVITLPGFHFDKYSMIRKNVPTILSPNCWAGLLYHALGLEFMSPFINMHEDHDDYLKILKNLDLYMESSLEFVQMGYEIQKGSLKEFPIAKCADVTLYLNHYSSFEEANDCWERRKARLNLQNCLVMFYDYDMNRINEFCNLSFDRKICFVPFQSDNKNLVSLVYSDYMGNTPFFQVVNDGAKGYVYDLFDFMLYGRISLLMEYK